MLVFVFVVLVVLVLAAAAGSFVVPCASDDAVQPIQNYDKVVLVD